MRPVPPRRTSSRWHAVTDAMRIALFITCFNDALFPDVGRAVVTRPPAARSRGRLPGRSDVLRPDPLQLRLPGGLRPARRALQPACSPATTPSSRRRPRASRWSATTIRVVAEGAAGLASEDRASLAVGVDDLRPRVHRAHRVPRRRARRDRRRRPLPAHGRLPPDLPLRPAPRRRRPAPRLLEAVDGLTLVDLPHADECCGFGGTFAVKNADTSIAMGHDKAATSWPAARRS